MTNNQKIIKKCHDSYTNISENLYEIFEESLSPVEFLQNPMIKVVKKTAEITFPVGKKVVNECDVLSIQGHGSSNLYCVLELPDGSIETAKVNSHSTHLNSFIRIHKPSSPISAKVCFAVLLNLADFLNGPGFHNETLALTPYIPVSPYISLLLKPSPNYN